jgi:hypothetical protein
MPRPVSVLLCCSALLAGCGSSGSTSATTRHTQTETPAENAQVEREVKNAESPTGKRTRAREEHEGAANTAAAKVTEAWKHEKLPLGAPLGSDAKSISHHLLSLSYKCAEGIPTLGTYVTRGVEILEEAGISESPVELAAAFDKSAPGKQVSPDCRGILSALLVLIEKG